MITVLYDEGCPFCRRCRTWVEGQADLVPIRFVAMASPPALDLMNRVAASVRGAARGGAWADPRYGQQLVVVADDGAFWIGSDAFLIVLWALEEHRALALRLAHPWLRPWSDAFFDSLSSGRHLLSSIFGGGERCEDGHCGVAPQMTGAYR